MDKSIEQQIEEQRGFIESLNVEMAACERVIKNEKMKLAGKRVEKRQREKLIESLTEKLPTAPKP